MDLHQTARWLGMATLYLGFSSVMGTLLRHALLPHTRLRMLKLAMLYGMLLYLPATLFILDFADLEMLHRLGFVASGLLVTFLTFTRPKWIPSALWLRGFRHAYLAGAMTLSAMWGVSDALTTRAIGTSAVAAAAGVAGMASLWTALRPR